LKQDFPRLPILILADGLYPNTAYLRGDYSYISDR
ncbi:hypothetical protein BAZOLSSOX_2210, partial [uncultured Gammaproteobacteria bacterium]